jgi:hypothetical protein
MDKRELARMLRRTNTADLLDDGIENGSDLKSFAKTDDSLDNVDAIDDVPKVSKSGTPTQSSPLRDLPKEKAPEELPPGEPISYLGLFIGACFLVFGVVMFLYPRDVSVYHDRIKYKPFVEHVTSTGSQVYSVIAFVIGLALCWFSLYRPKR